MLEQVLHYFTEGDGWFIPLIALMILVELAIRVFRGQGDRVDHKEGWSSIVTDIAYFAIGVSLAAVVLAPIHQLGFKYRLWDLPNTWWTAALAVLLAELLYYWQHRLLQEVRLLWCIHHVHHSARDLSIATALRMPVLEPFAPAFIFVWIGPWLGFSTVDSLLGAGFNFLFGAFHHTTVFPRLGALDKFIPFDTPAQHRVHHGSDLNYVDRNYGGTLIVWDWLFNTFVDEQEEPTYGLTKDIDTYNPWTIHTIAFRELWHDLRQADSLWQCLQYLFRPPGWSPIGSTLTNRQLRKVASRPGATVTPG